MVGYVKAEIMEGDFTEDDSDVMVNSKVKTGQSEVASATLHECVPEVQNISDDFASRGCEERAYSTGGLKCKHVIHTIVSKSQKWLLGKMIATCLAYAEKLQRSSVCSSSLTWPNHYMLRVSSVCLEKTVCELFKDKFLEQVSKIHSGVEGVVSGGQQSSSQSKAPTLPFSMQISTADKMKVEKT